MDIAVKVASFQNLLRNNYMESNIFFLNFILKIVKLRFFPDHRSLRTCLLKLKKKKRIQNIEYIQIYIYIIVEMSFRKEKRGRLVEGETEKATV